MKRFGKLLALTAIVSVLGVSIPFQSFAASKTISSVTIYAGLEELESGENLPEETAFEQGKFQGQLCMYKQQQIRGQQRRVDYL